MAPDTLRPRWIKFANGNLQGLSFYLTEEYSKTFNGGNTDPEMMSDIIIENPAGKTIYDVGGFMGASSLLFAKMVGQKGRVISFEPNTFNLERMNKNFSKNKDYGNIIETYTCALSNRNGTTNMYLSNNVDGGPSSTSRINESHSTIRNENLPNSFIYKEVETKRLDDFVRETGIVPEIIKVDIEGAEHMLLEGAFDTLNKHKPLLYIEIHSEYCAIRCYEILKDHGYSLVVINEEPDNRIMVKAKYNNTRDLNDKDFLDRINYNFQQTSDRLSSQLNKLETLSGDIDDIVHSINDMQDQRNLMNENNVLKLEIGNLKSEIDRIHRSKSWHITKPLRSLLALTKSIKTRIRSINH